VITWIVPSVRLTLLLCCLLEGYYFLVRTQNPDALKYNIVFVTGNGISDKYKIRLLAYFYYQPPLTMFFPFNVHSSALCEASLNETEIIFKVAIILKFCIHAIFLIISILFYL